MRFVTVTHPDVGTASVPEISVPNMLPNGWTLADEPAPEVTAEPAPPTKRASRARTSRKES